MTLPLYDTLQQDDPNDNPNFTMGHRGLLFDRFYNAYLQPSDIKPRSELSKREKDRLIEQTESWLKKFEEKKAGNDNALEAKTLQQMALCQTLKGTSFIAKTQWHFVTGMGLPHPIENGMAWHPTLGVPYLTGAAVKGMVRAWLEVWKTDDDNAKQKKRLLTWFGSEDKESISTQAGNLIFFDALPIEAVTLGIDIMTPHMGKWYAKGQQITSVERDSEKLPADWHDPGPVKFLVVKQACLHFSIAPRNKRCAEGSDIENVMEDVMEALKNALEWSGAGAKTAVGYGGFEQDDGKQKKMEETRRQKRQEQQEAAELKQATESMPPLAAEFHRQAIENKWSEKENKNAFLLKVDKWVDKLEANPIPELQEHIEALMEQHFPAIMSDPDAMKPNSKKPRPLFREGTKGIAHRLIALRKK